MPTPNGVNNLLQFLKHFFQFPNCQKQESKVDVHPICPSVIFLSAHRHLRFLRVQHKILEYRFNYLVDNLVEVFLFNSTKTTQDTSVNCYGKNLALDKTGFLHLERQHIVA